jgi:hypothetical protein
VTPKQLLVRLTLFFTGLIGAVFVAVKIDPDVLRWLPIGGNDAIELARLEVESVQEVLSSGAEITVTRITSAPTPGQVGLLALFLSISLGLTMALMAPITWTYMAAQQKSGYRKTFVRALIVLPVCATTIVLLIQDSLALAFGLAALVAAVRFRVNLQEPIDGIYIFAAICVGLAAGIGYLGIATIMAVFFCFANAWLWKVGYGHNPLDDARAARDRAKLEKKKGAGERPPDP